MVALIYVFLFLFNISIILYTVKRVGIWWDRYGREKYEEKYQIEIKEDKILDNFDVKDGDILQKKIETPESKLELEAMEAQKNGNQSKSLVLSMNMTRNIKVDTKKAKMPFVVKNSLYCSENQDRIETTERNLEIAMMEKSEKTNRNKLVVPTVNNTHSRKVDLKEIEMPGDEERFLYFLRNQYSIEKRIFSTFLMENLEYQKHISRTIHETNNTIYYTINIKDDSGQRVGQLTCTYKKGLQMPAKAANEEWNDLDIKDKSVLDKPIDMLSHNLEYKRIEAPQDTNQNKPLLHQ